VDSTNQYRFEEPEKDQNQNRKRNQSELNDVLKKKL
jgi:hypothetical protein